MSQVPPRPESPGESPGEGAAEEAVMGSSAVSPDVFRHAIGRQASGVSVLTSRHESVDHAMTATTLTSVSLEPVLLLVCVELDARFHDAVVGSGLLGVSILAAEQRPLSDWFATRGRPVHGQLERAAHRRGAVTGVGLLEGSLATLECRVQDVHAAGDHSIIVARVLAIDLPNEAGAALVHFRGRYAILP